MCLFFMSFFFTSRCFLLNTTSPIEYIYHHLRTCVWVRSQKVYIFRSPALPPWACPAPQMALLDETRPSTSTCWVTWIPQVWECHRHNTHWEGHLLGGDWEGFIFFSLDDMQFSRSCVCCNCMLFFARTLGVERVCVWIRAPKEQDKFDLEFFKIIQKISIWLPG